MCYEKKLIATGSNAMRILHTVLVCVLLLITGKAIRADSPELHLHLLDVGQGLSVLVQCDGQYLLYDGGGRDASSFVVSYLKEQGVENLSYMIASHYDDDHLNGLVGALHVFDIEMILSPDYKADTKVYRSFLSAADQSGASLLHPVQGDSFDFGAAKIDITGPASYDYPAENNNCLCIRISYGDVSVLICGDAEAQAEEDMVNSGIPLESDIYVVNHHGSASSNSFYFLDHVDPGYVLLSCGKDNPYGHPDLEAMERLQSLGCTLYRTDRQGTIVLHSDGSSVWSDLEPCTDWSSNEDQSQSEQPTSEAASGIGYICNTNTKKFHYEFCDSVKKMKEENKLFTTESRDELISQGYSPCQNCNP